MFDNTVPCLICGSEDVPGSLDEMMTHMMSHDPAEIQAFIAIHFPETAVVLDSVVDQDPQRAIPSLLGAMARDLENQNARDETL